jgi:hypothetical protein
MNQNNASARITKTGMKLSTAVPAVLLALHLCATAAVTYDGFAFEVGGSLAGNTDWTSLNTGTAPVIAAGSLTVPGSPEPTGNKVSYSSGNIQEALAVLNTFDTDTVYFSLALQLTSVPTTATYSYALATANTNYGATVWIQADGTDGFNLGVANRSTSSPTYDTTKLALNTPYFIVGSYSFISGTGNDVSALWINPDPSTFGTSSAPEFTLVATGGADLARINQFLLRGAAGSPAGEFDELRVGSSWEAVTVPEPGAIAAILGGTAFLGLIRRRR